MSSARDHLMNKYNLSMIHKSHTQIQALKEARCTPPTVTCANYNPFVVKTSNIERNELKTDSTGNESNTSLQNQYIRSSSQYTNHNIYHASPISTRSNESKPIASSKKYCNLCDA